MEDKVIYIGFFTSGNEENRYVALSALNKMSYLIASLNKNNQFVQIVSPSWLLSSKGFFSFKPSKNKFLSDNLFGSLYLAPSIESKFTIFGYINRVISAFWLFFWLLKFSNRKDKIIVYHSPFFALPILLAQMVVGFRYILEIEEIYYMVWPNNIINKYLEDLLISYSDRVIAVSNNLKKIVGERKVQIVLYGDYTFRADLQKQISNFDSIMLVYAGIVDRNSSSAFIAIECLDYLPDNYVVHILGYGSSKDINDLLELVNLYNLKLNRIACVFHGSITGDHLVDFLSKCQIGLNPQQNLETMSSAFPSKILFYLSCNLKVVSTEVKSIKESPFSEFIKFSESRTAESFSKAILSTNLNSQNGEIVKLFSNLDLKFKQDLQNLINRD